MSDPEVRYRFLSVLGEGGFGKVYRARLEGPDGFHKDVAIKVLHDPEPVALLRRHTHEARLLGLVRDRAVVGVEPPIRIGKRWAVVMEYVEGASCGALLATHGRLPSGVAVEIVGEVARALHNVYGMDGPDGAPLRLLHRDITPDNVQLTSGGEVRLLDFGIASSALAVPPHAGLVGTPGYIPPERAMGQDGPEGDVYGLGVVLYELVTGQRPRLDEDDVTDPDPDVRAVLVLAARMRCSDPGDRPTAREVERACRELRNRLSPPYLRDWCEDHVRGREIAPDGLVGRVVAADTDTLGQSPEPPTEDRPAEPFVAWSRRARAVAFAAVGAGVLALAVGWVLVRDASIGEGQATPSPLPMPAAAAMPELRTPPVATEPPPTSTPTPAPASLRPTGTVDPRPAERVPVASAPIAPAPPPAGPPIAITFASIPLGATVALESGAILGRTPLRYALSPGTYRVTMTDDDGHTSVGTVRVGGSSPVRYVWRVAEDRWESGY